MEFEVLTACCFSLCFGGLWNLLSVLGLPSLLCLILSESRVAALGRAVHLSASAETDQRPSFSL